MLIKVFHLFTLMSLLFLVACTEKLPIDSLLNTVREYNGSLEPLAILLKKSGDGAIIDLRGRSVRLSPDIVKQEVSLSDIETLNLAKVNFASYDSDFGGVIFDIHSTGIGISGLSMGYIFITQSTSKSELVDDLQLAFENKKSLLKKHESLDVKLVQKINANWGIYLETY